VTAPRPETIAPLSPPSARPNEVLATRTYRQESIAAHEASQTGAATASLDRSVAERSATRTPRDVAPAGPKTPTDPLLSPKTKGNLARATLYTGIGLGGLAGLTAIGGWAQNSILSPLSQDKVNEANAQTPQVNPAGLCAKIVTAPGQSTLLDDAECRAMMMRQYLSDPNFSDAYRQYFLGPNANGGPGSVEATPVTKPPPTFADKALKVAIAAGVVTLTGAAAYGGYRYVRAHPDKIRKAGEKLGLSKSKPATPA
jgi:hypothetical protein